ncbi:MAG: hypothetical protein KGI71_05310, partial [Patescibacteria group bacterium]|nr:hypothetical protein [Patescibacteria group bacterium]
LSESIARARPHLEGYLTAEDSPPERLHAVAAMLGAQGADLLGRSAGSEPALALVERIGPELVASGPATIGALLTFLAAQLYQIADTIADRAERPRIHLP